MATFTGLQSIKRSSLWRLVLQDTVQKWHRSMARTRPTVMRRIAAVRLDIICMAATQLRGAPLLGQHVTRKSLKATAKFNLCIAEVLATKVLRGRLLWRRIALRIEKISATFALRTINRRVTRTANSSCSCYSP